MGTTTTASQQQQHHHLHRTTSHSQPSASLNRLALSATVHCFTGCAIGEVLGMVLARAFGWNAAASIAAAIFLAFVFGYSFTLIPLLRNGMTLAAAAPLALAADTVSITVMEVVDNAMMLIIPGAMDADLSEPVFWGSLVLSLAVAFVAVYPVNRWLITGGRGHAAIHQHHSGH